MRLLFLLFTLFCWCSNLQAQQPVRGVVTDPEGNPLAFVTVLLNDEPGKGVLTDIEGRFSIDPKEPLRMLGFRYVGFETLRIAAEAWQKTPGKPLAVVLQPADYALPEATIRAGENPADILMRKAIANRRRNNPELRRSYTCTTYNKILFDAVPNRSAFEKAYAKEDSSRESVRESRDQFSQLERAMSEHHGFLMESVTERSFLFPNQVQERVLLNRVSGFQNAGLVALANMVQPFTFYGDYLTILDKNFVNPVSPGSPNLYFFNLEDTLYSGPDTVWVISFHPRKGKVFEGLEGVLHLNSRGWAVQNVRTQPAQAGNLMLTIEQAYQLVPESDEEFQWFPAQLNFELEFRKYPSEITGLRAAGRSYITDVRMEAPVRLRDINPDQPVLLEPGANQAADSAWVRWRTQAPLSGKELRTYAWLDSLGKTQRFDRLSTLMDILSTGKVPLGRSPVSIDLRHVLRFNEFEGTRLGIGFTTARAKPLLPQRAFEVGANAGYGTRDKAWKYGGYALWRPTPSRQSFLRVAWRRDLLEPGAVYELPPSAFFNRALYALRMDRVDEFSAALGSRLGRYVSVEAQFRKQDLQPTYAYRYGEETGNLTDRFGFSEATLMARYVNGERPGNFLATDIGTTQRLPVIELAYTRGWRGVWGGQYNYERWTVALHHSFFVRRLGRTRWRIEAGWASEDAPMAKLFTLNQTGGNFNLFVLPNTFQALPDTLFLADRFVNLYLAQEIGPVLYRSKYSAPFLTLLQNAAWGDLRRPELHQDQGFRTAATPLLESGVQLDNLLRFNYLNFAYIGVGGAAFYRWGGLQANDWQDNLSFRITMRFAL